MSLTASKKGQVEGESPIVSSKDSFYFPPPAFHNKGAKRRHEVPIADRVRASRGFYPSSRWAPPGGHRFEGQARFFSSQRKSDDLFGILRNSSI
jgi:hypothetical protein